MWGVNDFDEAATLPYTFDLVRLATSAGLAAAEGHLAINLREACAAVRIGYASAIRSGGRPFVLAENDRWLRKLATGRLRDPVVFWERINARPPARRVETAVQQLLLDRLPDGADRIRFVRRRSGAGSLGRERVAVLAQWEGSSIAHEAKALAPSGWEWAHPTQRAEGIHYIDVMSEAVRCPDPTVEVHGGWLVRRLSPDCGRVELASLPRLRDEGRLLKAMAWEAANIHLGTRGAAKVIAADLRRRKPGWLRDAATRMGRRVRQDWKDWRAARAT